MGNGPSQVSGAGGSNSAGGGAAQAVGGNALSGSGVGLAGYTNFITDAREKYLFAAAGNRGWLENGREEVGTFEIDVSQ